MYAAPLGLQILYGTTSIWMPEYLNVHLSIANTHKAKFWGMLNVKYVSSKEPIGDNNFELVKKFEPCTLCTQSEKNDGVDGPYLYKNKMVLPRAYHLDHAILVYGDVANSFDIMYSILLNNHFNPAKVAVIVGGDQVQSIEPDFINHFSAVYLSNISLNDSSLAIVNKFYKNGGAIFPARREGVPNFNREYIESVISSFNGSYDTVKEMNISYYSPNKVEINLNGEEGFLVLAEKYFMFEGWQAHINGKEKHLFRTNGMSTAILLDGETGTLTFQYKPKSFRNGALITTLTIILILMYFVWQKKRNKKMWNLKNEGLH